MSIETNNLLVEEPRGIEAAATIDSARNARLARASAGIEQAQSAEMADLTHALKQKSVNEVEQMDHARGRNRVIARISQVVDYIFYLIYGLISLQFMLELINARPENQIVRLITTLTLPILSPFKHIVATPSAGAYEFQISYLLALVFYLLLHLAINGMFRLIANRKVTI